MKISVRDRSLHCLVLRAGDAPRLAEGPVLTSKASPTWAVLFVLQAEHPPGISPLPAASLSPSEGALGVSLGRLGLERARLWERAQWGRQGPGSQCAGDDERNVIISCWVHLWGCGCVFNNWNDGIYSFRKRSICKLSRTGYICTQEVERGVEMGIHSSVYIQSQVFQPLWLGQLLSGEKKIPGHLFLSTCSVVETVERLLSDQTALCVLVLSWPGLGWISSSVCMSLRTKFGD